MGMTTVETGNGTVGLSDQGAGDPVLFVHGSPGGWDQGELMGRFLVDAGFRVISPSRPGYPGTPLGDANATPSQQADLHLAVLDALGLDRVALMCWSGGGPSSYALAASHPARISRIAALAAVSKPYTFEHPHEEGVMFTHIGAWLMREMGEHAAKSAVKMLITEEGDLDKEQAKELVAAVWDDPGARAFVLDLIPTVTGKRGPGVRNDRHQFPELSLDLPAVSAPTLLVHAETDADVPVEHSENAAALLPDATFERLPVGTHISVWTDPGSATVREMIVEHLRG